MGCCFLEEGTVILALHIVFVAILLWSSWCIMNISHGKRYLDRPTDEHVAVSVWLQVKSMKPLDRFEQVCQLYEFNFRLEE